MSAEEWGKIQRKNVNVGRPRIHPIKIKSNKPGTGWKGRWRVTAPGGDIIVIDNLSKFCKKHGLSTAGMSSVSLGGRKHYRGYNCDRII